MALLVPAAAAGSVGPYRFTGTVWNPKALPETPAVGDHPLTPATPAAARARTPLRTYRPQAPVWPAAGAVTLDLAARAAKPAKAGRLPVWVSAAGPAAGARSSGADDSAPAVRVEVASHAQAMRAGADAMLIGVSSQRSGSPSSRVQVVVDYAALAKAYGGGYGSRLRLVQLPACALTTPQLAACQRQTPLAFTNRVGAAQLTATVQLSATTEPTAAKAPTGSAAKTLATTAPAAAGAALAVSSGSSGSQGDYSATSLSQSGNWQTSATGSFTYTYPINVPSALGGNTPSVSLDYDSQSQDGETSARNSQSSWIGDGWSYQPGFVERSYRGCGTLLDSDDKKILKGSGDECWGGYNAALSFGSHSGTLVPTALDPSVPGELKAWKLQGDDGTVVQELSGAANGLQDGTYFRVLTTDGTAAYFGAEHSPTGAGTTAAMQSGTPADDSTDSAWGVPVLHPTSGDPCYTTDKGKASRCAKPEGWRWNLDFVVSPGGFVQRLDYGTETNHYDLGGGQAATGSDGTLVSYTRGGSLSSISYGYTLADEQAKRTPAARVDFGTAQRCQSTSGFTDCSAGNLNDSTAPHWPDVPWDLHCDAGDSTHLPTGSTTVPTNVCVTSGPTFFTTARLDSITTQAHVKDATTDKLVPVDSYQLGQVYSDAGGTVDPVTGTTVDPADAGSLQAVMWLQSIRHTGKDTYGNGNNDIALNQISFTGTEIDNRVNDSSPSAPPLYHPRISSIQTETGESVAVEYDQQPCAGKTLTTGMVDSNTNSCYPVYWTVPGASKPIADWFNKITVHQVTTADLTIASQYHPDAQKIPAGSEAHVSTYAYSGPAWHRDDSAFTDDQYRTWDEFRGFRKVTVQNGRAPEPVTQTSTTYLQGMDGDRKADGSRRTVSVDATVGGSVVQSVTDADNLAGAVLQTDTYAAAGGAITAATVNGPYATAVTASAAQTPWTDWTQADNPGESKPTLSTLPDLISYRAKTFRTSGYSLLADGTWRHTETDGGYDSQGRVVTLDVHGDVSVPAQEKCTNTSYATPAASNTMMLSYPDQTTVVSGPCGTAVSAGSLLSDRKVYYDGSGTPADLGTFGQIGQGGNPAAGQVTAVRVATGWTGATENWQTNTAMSYDGAGRVTDSYDVTGLNTHTDFTPLWSASGGNTNPVGITTYNAKRWKNSSVLDPLRGLPTEDTDANNRVTDIAYDALGRRTAVWLPGRDHATQSPDMTFAYSVNPGAVAAPGDTITSPGAPTSVTTRTLREDGTYATSVAIYDGMLQARQTQSTAAGDTSSGRVISDTFYDSHGWPTASYAPYSEPTSAPGDTLYAANENETPAETTTGYDGLGRALTSTLWHQAQRQWQTSTAYPGADETDSTAPAGGRSTATFSNALGQVTSSVVKNTGSPVTLSRGQTIPSGTSLASGSVRLAMRADGDLVLTGLATGKTLWSSGTSGHPGAWATFQADGNLVVYDTARAVLWASGTASTGTVLQIQNDADMAIDNAAGTVVWSTNTARQANTADATTRFTYNRAGQVDTVKDTAGNVWSYGYDFMGRPTSQTDPDIGTSTFDKYDVAGNLLQVTDPRGQILSYTYDWKNRPTAAYSGPWSPTPDPAKELTSAVFDTLAKGYPTSSTRYVNGATGTTSKAYTQAVTGYNTAYQVAGSSLTVPAADGFAAAGQSAAPASGSVTYTSTSTYTPTTGLLSTTHYQADGHLPAEDVDFGYTQQGNLDSFGGFINSSNTPAYLDTTVHDPFGRVLQTNYGPTGKELATFAQYDATTGRTSQTSSMLQTSATALDVTNYRYDRSGQITAIDDLQNNTTHDTQCFSYDSFQRLTAAWTDTGGVTDPGTAQPGAVGGCANGSVQTTGAGPVRTSTVGGPAAYWQTYTYDLLGDRTGMVSHDPTGNALNDTTQSTVLPGADGTAAATRPDEAGTTTTANPATGTATTTPTYTDPAHGNTNAGGTANRKITSTGPLVSSFTLSGGGKKCIEDASSSTTAGSKVQINTCGTAAGQKWSLGADATVRVQGLCLDTTGNAVVAGTKIIIDTCNTDATQKWKRTTTGTLVSAAAPTLCLTDPAASSVNATQLTLAACGSAGQTWTDASTGAVPAGQTQSFTYDAEGRTATVSTGTGTHTATSKYLYDSSGSLLEQTSATDSTDTTRILYLFGGTEQITLNVAAKTWTGLRNYVGPDGTTITRSSTGSVTYQVAGLQGTATAAIDATTLAVTRRSYDPYGNLRGAKPAAWVAPDENRGFLGQPTDAATGLDLLGARNYDPVLGRFLTSDPVFQGGDPNQMGGYTYAADNPVNGSDPSGYDDWYNDPTMNICVVDCDPPPGNPNAGGSSTGGSSSDSATSSSAPPPAKHHSSSTMGKIGNFLKGATNTVAEGINPDCYIGAVFSAAADYCNDVFNGDFKDSDSYKTGQIFTWIGTAGISAITAEAEEANEARAAEQEEKEAAAAAKKTEKDAAKSKAPTAGNKAAAESAGDGTPPVGDDWEHDPTMNKAAAAPSDPAAGTADSGSPSSGGHASRGHNQPKAGKNLPSSAKVAKSVTHGSRPDGNTVIAGHGWYDKYAESFEMPRGTWLKCFCADGLKLDDSVGLQVEMGGDVPPVETILPGGRMRDIFVGPPRKLNIATGSVTVSEPTLLSDLLEENMGCVYLATCRELTKSW
ncbi:ricin-type beta-trefoil lectin domain protein [Streptomyces sp. SPB162]|uniref:ricin-type beta-trefoil lectin domain protein n=1 Tax=Streptomyces sp. SPB162 TaxID=2940560 RepID=UPI002404AFDB|nr:ricin-type beta-trefoil lectin domain protein [Streptomyces sp. SPB162]